MSATRWTRIHDFIKGFGWNFRNKFVYVTDLTREESRKKKTCKLLNKVWVRKCAQEDRSRLNSKGFSGLANRFPWPKIANQGEMKDIRSILCENPITSPIIGIPFNVVENMALTQKVNRARSKGKTRAKSR